MQQRAVDDARLASSLRQHLNLVVQGISKGLLVPLLGAGAATADRERDFNAGTTRDEGLPTGQELASAIAREFEYPHDGDELARVSQYIEAISGRLQLDAVLRSVFARPTKPSSVHRFFADLPAVLREFAWPYPCQIILTTNYDDCMETAFAESGEPYDVLWYFRDRQQHGAFWHRPYLGEPVLVERPERYMLDLPGRSFVVKLHGSFDSDSARDTYVVTEDDYVDYLVRADLARLLPWQLVEKLRRCHFLFLGYGLQDWNVRVILHRIWGEQRVAAKSWAVKRSWNEVDRELWSKRNVDLVAAELKPYLSALRTELQPKLEAG